jgi:hypothetical protein
MKVYPSPHHPYRKRPSHEKRYAKGVKKHNLAPSAPAAQLIAQGMWHMTHSTPMPVRLSPEFPTVLLGIKPHNILFKPLEELRRPFCECHRFIGSLCKKNPLIQNMPFNCFVHVEKDIKYPSRSQ